MDKAQKENKNRNKQTYKDEHTYVCSLSKAKVLSICVVSKPLPPSHPIPPPPLLFKSSVSGSVLHRSLSKRYMNFKKDKKKDKKTQTITLVQMKIQIPDRYKFNLDPTSKPKSPFLPRVHKGDSPKHPPLTDESLSSFWLNFPLC